MISLKKMLNNAALHGNSELSRIGYLDGWRGLAISSVLIHHFFTIEGIDLGRMGVDIFFVLSGMLMSNILFIKRVDLKTFYKRRISRILPAFIIFLTFICLLSYTFNLSNEHENYFYLLSFIRSYYPESPNIWNTGIPVGHLWSLNVEEHYYIFLSFITLITIFKGKEGVPLIILGTATIFLHYLYLKYPELSSGFFQLKSQVVASHLFISSGYFLIKKKFKPYIHPWMPIVAFILGIFCYLTGNDSNASWVYSPFLFAFTVNHLDIISISIQRLLSNKILQLLGVYSYSIYLWQQPFFYYGVKHELIFPYAEIILLFCSVATGVASFYIIENPVRKYLNTKW